MNRSRSKKIQIIAILESVRGRTSGEGRLPLDQRRDRMDRR